MENEIRDIIKELQRLQARLEALLPKQDTPQEEMAEAEVEEMVADAIIPVNAPINFTLNDRYRFQRELFGGSAEEMHRVVDALQAMDSEAEVTDYIRSLDWAHDNAVVKDFVAAVTERFKATPTLLA